MLGHEEAAMMTAVGHEAVQGVCTWPINVSTYHLVYNCVNIQFFRSRHWTYNALVATRELVNGDTHYIERRLMKFRVRQTCSFHGTMASPKKIQMTQTVDIAENKC